MIQIPNFEQLSVLVIGDVMLDRYVEGGVSRISPEAPVPVVKHSQSFDRLGGAANVAANLTQLGVSATLAGIVGADEAGDVTEQLLADAQIKSKLIHVEASQTITKTRLMSRSQQLLRVDTEDEFQISDQQTLLKQVCADVARFDAVIISDYAKSTLPNPQALISTASEHGVPVVIDPKGSDYLKYAGATLITPNYSEFTEVAGNCATDTLLFERAQALRAELNLEALVVTLSERGIALINEGNSYRIATQAKEVFDVTGAGDTVIAVIAASLAAKQSLDQAVRLANAAASVVVAKTGTATLNQTELEQALHQNSSSNELPKGLLAFQDIKKLQELLLINGSTLVMTNGCFDLLHPGHIAYLAQAKKLGDYLLIAVNSDDSVSRLKGDSRPINPLTTRLTMLSALESVDGVISFEDDTPEQLIAQVLPDVLVKGGDYEVEQIAGHRQVLANGGEVKVLKFLDGFSSSELIARIKST